MNDKAGKVLVAESDDSLREHIVAVLSDAGYEVTTDDRGGMKAVVAFNPDIVVMGADPAIFIGSSSRHERPARPIAKAKA
jgi:hypothetical protein